MTDDAEGAGEAAGHTSRRRLAAIVFADVAGYTELSSRDEDLALRVIEAFQAISRKIVSDHGGRVVKFLGDGMLAEFNSLDSAVASAHVLQGAFTRMEEANQATVALRVGVHLGDIVFSDDGDVYGSGVNVASRIESHAPPSGIVVSDSAYRHLRNRRTYQFSSIGQHELKGVPDPMELYVVLLEGQQAPQPAVRVIPEKRMESPARVGTASWAAGVVFTVLLIAFLTDLGGVRGATLDLAGGLIGGSGATFVERPTFTGVEGGASVRGPIRLAFSGPIDPTTATRESVQLLDPDGAPIPIEVHVQTDARSLEVRPARPLDYETRYRILLNSLLRSAAGLGIELPEAATPPAERLAFVTQPVPSGAPRLVASDPADGAEDAPSDGEIRLEFDAPLEARSVDELSVALSDEEGRPVRRRVICCGDDGRVLLLVPEAPLGPARYDLLVGRGLAGADGVVVPPARIAFHVVARAEAEAAAAAPVATGPGTLTIRVVPASLAPRSEVFLGGRRLGTPPIQGLTLPEGVAHRIEVFGTSELSPHRLPVFSQSVTLQPGQTRVLEARVDPFGTISIVANPAGVVYLNGTEIGPTPLHGYPVLAERDHELEIRPTGAAAAIHTPYRTRFRIAVGEDRGLGRVELPRGP